MATHEQSEDVPVAGSVARTTVAQRAHSDLPLSQKKTRGLWSDAWRRLRKNKLALSGLVVIGVLTLIAIFAPLIAPYGYRDVVHSGHTNAGPGEAGFLGADNLGRDVFSRLLYGARISLSVGLVVQMVVVFVGVPLGAIAGYFGGWVDTLISRLIDIMYAFPTLLLIVLLSAALRESPIKQLLGGLFIIFIAIGLSSWVGDARLMRGQIISLKDREYVEAARALGAKPGRILWKHLIPNALGPILVSVTFGIPGAIFAEAALSYLGIGVIPPTPSWGAMINDGQQAIFYSPSQVIFPGIAIALTMLSFTFLGDGLRDALDPRGKRGA
ncbi:MAG: ABC transporter permease [Thermomicrobia bacterium]|nr:ABC transporter permease [Thermomicrobia bacterium]